MRLLKVDETSDLELVTVDDDSAVYAILSHRWLADEEEVTHEDVKNGREVTHKKGWQKLQFLRKQALKDGLQYAWSDTCCIDKGSSQELTESINSMYRWYANAECCYVFLHDMPGSPVRSSSLSICRSMIENAQNKVSDAVESPYYYPPPVMLREGRVEYEVSSHYHQDTSVSRSAASTIGRTLSPQRYHASEIDCDLLQKCEWFTRGWTLQELVAPVEVLFFDRNWKLLGDHHNLADQISNITGVPVEALTKVRRIDSYSIAQRLSWAARRRTSKPEDRAYSLIGLLGVNIGIVYGEGDAAFQRLQEELLRTSADDSIFVFGIDPELAPGHGTNEKLRGYPLLARSIDQFAESSNVAISKDHPASSSRQCEIVGKDVVFRNYGMIRKYREDCYFAVLSCWDETDMTKMITLRLVKYNRDSYYASSTKERIRQFNAYGFVDSPRWRTKTFNVARQPSRYGYWDCEQHVVMCRFNPSISDGGSFRIARLERSYEEKVLWHQQKQHLVVSCKDQHKSSWPFIKVEYKMRVGRPSVLADTIQPAGILQPPGLTLYTRFWYPAIQVRLSGKSLTLPRWITKTGVSSPYHCTMKWHQGGLLVVRSFSSDSINYYLAHHYHLLEVQHAGLLRILDLFTRTILLLIISVIVLLIKYSLWTVALALFAPYYYARDAGLVPEIWWLE